MSRMRTVSSAVLVVCLLSVVPVVLLADSSPPPIPEQIAKLPTENAAAAPAPAPDTAAPTTLPATTPAAPSKQIAQLLEAAPSPGSAGDWLEAAEVYRWLEKPAEQRAYLEQAAALSPGSVDSAKALVLLGQLEAEAGAPEAAARFLQAKEQCADATLQAFADLAQDYRAALRAEANEHARDLLITAAQTWRGSWLGGWAAIRLAEVYQYRLGASETAAEVLRQVTQDYRGTPIGTEALLELADFTSWWLDRPAEAVELYRQARDEATTARLRVRAELQLANGLLNSGNTGACYEQATQLIDALAGRPEQPIAIIYQAGAARARDNMEVALAGARAYLAAGIGWTYWRGWALERLGADAFQQGDWDAAEQYYADAVTEPDVKARSLAALGNCRSARGDLSGAVDYFLQAADAAAAAGSRDAPLHLYRAARAAQQAKLTTVENQIAARMVAEYPGSYLTTRLVGYEVLPAPEI